jgi:molybdopterin molybdotransferase
MKSELPNYEHACAVVDCIAKGIESRLPPAEVVDLDRAAGRVLAEPLIADMDQPPFARSTRDGFACRADEANRHQSLRVAGSVHAGHIPEGPLPSGSAWEIMTGAPLPDGADAVAMIEHVEHVDANGGQVRLLPPRQLEPGENIVAQGAQARAGQRLLEPGIPITFAQIALAASCGYAMLKVSARPQVAILATGDEIVPVDRIPAPGQIRNSNAPMLAAMVEAAGGEPWILPSAADTAEALDAALVQARQAEMLIVSGGVSAGKFDLVEPALARAGAQFHFTGVRIQPGKPLVFGEMPRAEDRRSALPFFGLPGNPVSSAVTFTLFATRILAALTGKMAGPRFALARLVEVKGKTGRHGFTRFLPAACDFNASTDALPEVRLTRTQGSGDLAALALSNCFVVAPEDIKNFEEGEIVRILLT